MRVHAEAVETHPWERLVAATGLHERTSRVYLAMVEQPEVGVTELAVRLGLSPQELREDLDRMASLSLIQPTSSPDFYLAVAPHHAAEVLIARAEERIAREQTDIQRTRDALPDLLEAFVQPRLTHGSAGELEYLDDPTAVSARLVQLVGTASRSVSFLLPGDGLPEQQINHSRALDLECLARGVRNRTIVATQSLASPPWCAYLHEITAAGAEVRVVDAPPMLQIILDDEVSIIPLADSLGACVQHSRNLSAPSVAMFEEVWARATPLELALLGPEDDLDLDPKHRMVLALLAQGMTDEGLARRMSCSTRTVGRIISEVMHDLHASSRFQAGVLAEQRGLLPRHRPV